MGLLSKPPRCQIPAERLTIAFPTQFRKYDREGRAVINSSPTDVTPRAGVFWGSGGSFTLGC